MVLLSTYDEDEFDLDGCGAAAYVAKAAFGPDRLSEAWAAARRLTRRRTSATGIRERDQRVGSRSRRDPPTASTRSTIACRSTAPAETPATSQHQVVVGDASARSRRGSTPTATPPRSRSRRPPPPAARTAARPPRRRRAASTASPLRARSDRSAGSTPGPGQLGREHAAGQLAQRLERRRWCRPRDASTPFAGDPSRDGSASTGELVGHRHQVWQHLARDRLLEGPACGVVGLDDPRRATRRARRVVRSSSATCPPAGSPSRRCGTRPRPGRRAPSAAARRTAAVGAPWGSDTAMLPSGCAAVRTVDHVRRRCHRRRRGPSAADDRRHARHLAGSPSARRADTARPAASATAGSRVSGDGVSARRPAEVGQRLVGLGPGAVGQPVRQPDHPAAQRLERQRDQRRWPAGTARSRSVRRVHHACRRRRRAWCSRRRRTRCPTARTTVRLMITSMS